MSSYLSCTYELASRMYEIEKALRAPQRFHIFIMHDNKIFI